MKVGKRYIVQRKDSNKILEWLVIEIGENAIKVQNLIKITDNWLFSNTINEGDLKWILNSDIDKLGNTEYRIIEELK